MTRRSRHLVAGFAILLVVAGIVGGLVILGPPSEARVRRLDQKRVGDLQGIRSSVAIFRMRHERFPVSLDELTPEDGLAISSRDPETMQPYEYRPVDLEKFELCAVFARTSSADANPVGGDFWSHGAGRRCFQPAYQESPKENLNWIN